MNKPKIKIFLSYARKDERDTKMVTTFLEELSECFKASKHYEYEIWADWEVMIGEGWHEKIKGALDECDYGLMLVSLPFINSDYILQHELPDLLTTGRGLPVGFKKFDINKFDLKGLLPTQIFRYEEKFYSELNGQKKIDFIHQLFHQVEAKLLKLGPSKPNDDPEISKKKENDENQQSKRKDDIESIKYKRTNLNQKTLIGLGGVAFVGFIYFAGQLTDSNTKKNLAGELRLDNDLFLVSVKEGANFRMGGNINERFNEKPVHKVTFKEPFWISTTEVTFAQYDAFLKAKGAPFKPKDEGWGRDTRPVINVSWHEAKAFTAWLTKNNKGLSCRLPSEAEWEYAARGKDSEMAYFWGEKGGFDNANCKDCEGPWEGKNKTSPVGEFKENALKLLDMHGNVAEWVEDIWHADYQGAPVDGSVWKTSGKSARRVIRGGSWTDKSVDIRSAHRSSSPPEASYNWLGFRVVCHIDPN